MRSPTTANNGDFEDKKKIKNTFRPRAKDPSTQSTSVLFGNAMRKNVRKMMETLSQLFLLNLLFENIFLT